MTKHQTIEEPDEMKVSCPVLKTNGLGDKLVEFNTNPIDQLVEYFGTTLEKLTLADKLALRVTLTYWLFHREVADLGEYTLNHAMEDTMQGYSEDCQINLKEAIAILEGIGKDEAEGLIESLTAQLRCL